MAAKLLDGYLGVLGVDGSQDRLSGQRGRFLSAVNRSFRGSKNATRPPIRDIKLSYDSDQTKEALEKGAVAGAFGYSGWRGSSKPCLVVAVHDRLVRILIVGRAGYASTIKAGLSTGNMHSWFSQAHDRLYFQNDIDNPVGWDGANPSYEIAGDYDKMPRGSAMAYANGRLALVTGEGSYVVISDHIYGNGLYDTKGAEKFIEYQQFNDLGAIGSYAELGKINGAAAMPVTDSINGQGAYIFICANGFWTFDPSGERSTWLYGNRQIKSYEGSGCPSPFGFATIHNDLYYVSSDGSITSYKRQKSELEKAGGALPISNEVAGHLAKTPEWGRKFVSLAYADDRLLATCGITVSESELGGFHRFGTGMVSLDFNRISVSSESPGFAWDGLWTGPNPIQVLPLIIDGEKRCFVLSHDDDGKNRIFEMLHGRIGNDEYDGVVRVIQSSFETSNLFPDGPGQQITLKKLSGVKVAYSDAEHPSSLGADYSPSFHEKWLELQAGKQVSCEPQSTELIPGFEAGSGLWRSSSIKDECLDGGGLAGISDSFRIRVRAEGGVVVRRLLAEAVDQKEAAIDPCPPACKPARADETSPEDYRIVIP